ncbi:acyl-CoA thioester hydrolase [Campylobacter sp. MIT 99-7217]|uniref:YbgC/FadM family acyl-CoA thioesterase n=1 Tax=Campylobacter sp. MIT 99-7217 TaxID=535091 RepID=UPI001157A511|nr:YbgC/FadM family acyl-CoA thioesterase [Campylobacter sp. MIT 99-7217]TQR34674.1 acyl-CoA thioester hydrolase [Campylobacter sp. MIT 99-7217]
MRIRVYYEDTDAGGVVYHSNYLKFCERARSELFFGKEPNIFDKDKGHFLLAKANCNFLKPAVLGDMLELRHELLEFKHASLILRQEIYKEETKIFSADFTLVYVQSLKPAVISDEIKELFLNAFKTPQS